MKGLKGTILERYPGSYSIVIDAGKKIDPVTGRTKRNQKWITVHGTEKDAKDRLLDLNYQMAHGGVIHPHRITYGAWLDRWLAVVIKPRRSIQTYKSYSFAVQKHIKAHLGSLPVQKVTVTHLQDYYNTMLETYRGTTIQMHQAIISGSLKAAVLEGIIDRNPAPLVPGKPVVRRSDSSNVWSRDQVAMFMTMLAKTTPQMHAFYALLLDTGMRKREIAGIRWPSVDFNKGQIGISEKLEQVNPPMWGPIKAGKPRGISISPQSIKLLKRHRAAQAEVKLASGAYYSDFNLVFARKDGRPLPFTNLGRELDGLIAMAGVPRIRFHDLRHTCATLLMEAGVHVRTVQERLGHASAKITMDIYGHVTDSMQQTAAQEMDHILTGC